MSRKKKIISLFLVLLLIIVICKFESINSLSKELDGITIKNSIAMRKYSQEDIINASTYIVEATVVKNFKSTVEDIYFPVTNEICKSIVTDTKVKVDNVIKGNILEDNIIIRSNIGKVKSTILISDEEATYQKNEKVLLFLNDDGLSNTYRLVKFIYGKYVYSYDDEYFNDYSGYTVKISDLISN